MIGNFNYILKFKKNLMVYLFTTQTVHLKRECLVTLCKQKRGALVKKNYSRQCCTFFFFYLCNLTPQVELFNRSIFRSNNKSLLKDGVFIQYCYWISTANYQHTIVMLVYGNLCILLDLSWKKWTLFWQNDRPGCIIYFLYFILHSYI